MSDPRYTKYDSDQCAGFPVNTTTTDRFSNLTNSVTEAVALVFRLQTKVHNLNARVTETQGESDKLLDEVNLINAAIGDLNTKIRELNEASDRAWHLNASRTAVMAQFTQKTENELNRLESNTKILSETSQKAFDGVGTDVKKLLELAQKQNERIGKLESQLLTTHLGSLNDRVEGLNIRLTRVEAFIRDARIFFSNLLKP